MSWVGLEILGRYPGQPSSIALRKMGDFEYYDGGGLTVRVPHTIRFWIKVNPGPDNDLVRVFIDGDDVGQCFTTWENYYRTAAEQEPPPNLNNPANINSLQFRSSVPGPDAPRQWWLPVRQREHHDRQRPWSARLRLGNRKGGRHAHGDGGRQGALQDHRPQPRGCQRPQRPGLRSHPAPNDVCACRPQVRRVGRRVWFVIPRLGPGQRASLNLTFAVDAPAPRGTITNIADPTPGVERPGLPGSPRRNARCRGRARPAGSGGRTAPAREAGSAHAGEEGQGRREDLGKAGRSPPSVTG